MTHRERGKTERQQTSAEIRKCGVKKKRCSALDHPVAQTYAKRKKHAISRSSRETAGEGKLCLGVTVVQGSVPVLRLERNQNPAHQNCPQQKKTRFITLFSSVKIPKEMEIKPNLTFVEDRMRHTELGA